MKHNFPITIIDNFFDDPFSVVKWSKSLDYKKDEFFRYPGVRSKNLVELDRNFIYELTKKILSIFYEKIPNQYEVQSYFDIIKSNTFEKGWIHRDDGELSYIIYLNEFYSKNCGTSLYTLKNTHTGTSDNNNLMSFKQEDFKNNIISTKGREARNYINSQYNKEIDIPPKFNRLLLFPSHHAHSANLLDTGTEEDRLILVGYISNIYSTSTPSQRFHKIFPDI